MWLQRQMGKEIKITKITPEEIRKGTWVDIEASLSAWQVLDSSESLAECMRIRSVKYDNAKWDSMNHKSAMGHVANAEKEGRVEKEDKEFKELREAFSLLEHALTLNESTIANSRCVPSDAVKLQ